MTTPEPFPLIDLGGAPEARGRDYGRQAAARVRKSLVHYGAQLGADGLEAGAVRALARDFVPQIEAFAPDYVAEMRGISEGANEAFEDIVLINCRTEILQLAKRRPPEVRKIEEQEPDGCTGTILLPAVTTDGKLVHGQNWDWKQECAETGVVLRIRREDGPDILTFVEAGGLARCGMNAAGIAITANYLTSDRDYRSQGVPLSLLRRKALEQEQLALTLRTIYTTPKSASNNLMVSQADGFGLNIECAPDESFLVQPQDGILVHANHWQSPIALSKLKDMGPEATPDSLYRDLRVRQILESQRGALGLEAMREAFFDDWQSPWSVCRPPRMNLGGNLSATVAMILMKPGDGIMEICPLPALNRSFTRYTLRAEGVRAAA